MDFMNKDQFSIIDLILNNQKKSYMNKSKNKPAEDKNKENKQTDNKVKDSKPSNMSQENEGTFDVKSYIDRKFEILDQKVNELSNRIDEIKLSTEDTYNGLNAAYDDICELYERNHALNGSVEESKDRIKDNLFGISSTQQALRDFNETIQKVAQSIYHRFDSVEKEIKNISQPNKNHDKVKELNSRYRRNKPETGDSDADDSVIGLYF